ncbi:MAG: hypothetical protein IPN95_22320 [Bacteroidetes bacterium]|nr:hypothetical protein [Bacteroidota bacterium]MBL0014994.1 hypothetical protein [Bacteroidota bacterium]MBP6639386.1 hypothetical protein [Bacteroidia bacterium]
MAAEVIDLMLNLSLLFAVLIAPSLLMLSVWYKKSLGKPVFIWPKSEMVLLTIVFFIVALVLFIVGVSCIFTYFGYLDPIRFAGINVRQFLNLGLCCNLAVIGLAMVYMGMRNMLVQMVMEKGIVMTRGILPLRNSVKLLEWSQIVDYYVVPDYPNVNITFIVAVEPMRFQRQSIKVPVYLKDEFQTFLDEGLQASKSPKTGSEISSSRYFSEN